MKTLMLLQLLVLVSADNYTFVLLWPEPGVQELAASLFETKFRPRLREECPAAGNATVHFKELLTPRRLSLRQAQLLDAQLAEATAAGSCCLLAGAAPLTQATAAALHSAASPPMSALAPLLAATVRSVFSPFNASLPVAVVVGGEYSVSELGQLVAEFYGGVRVFAIGDSDDSIAEAVAEIVDSVNVALVLAARWQVAELLKAAEVVRAGAVSVRWLLYDADLASRNSTDSWLQWSLNTTSVEFVGDSIGATTQKQLLLHDLLAVWQKFVAADACNQSTPSETEAALVQGSTGQFLLLGNGSLVRRNWQFRVFHGLGDKAIQVGSFSTSGEFNVSLPDSRNYTERQILEEYRSLGITILTVLEDPYVRFKPGLRHSDHLPLRQRLEGFSLDLCLQLLESLEIENVTVQLNESYGVETGVGWNGMVRSLMSGAADLGCSRLIPIPGMSDAVDLSLPYLQFNLSLLYAKPDVRQSFRDTFQFLSPFELRLWLLLIGSSLAVACLLALVHALSPNRESFAASYTVFFAFASLLQGLTGRVADRPSAQIMIGTYWMFVFCVLVAYAATYAGMRTLQRVESNVELLPDLLTQSRLAFGLRANSSLVSIFRDSTFDYMRRLYDKMDQFEHGFYNDEDKVAEKLWSSKFGIISDTPANMYKQQQLCRGQVVGHFFSTSAVLATPKASNLMPLLNSRLSNSSSVQAKVQALRKKYFTPTAAQLPSCTSDSQMLAAVPLEPASVQPMPGAMTLRDTLGIFLINIIGCVLTLIVAVAEAAWNRWSYSCRRDVVDGSDHRRITDRTNTQPNVPNVDSFDV